MKEAIVAAIEMGDQAQVSRMLNEDPELAGGCNEQGVSLIFVALYHRQEEIAKILAEKVVGLSIHEVAALGLWRKLETQLSQDIDLINTPTADGFPPLHLAAFFAREKAVDVLLRMGADANKVTLNKMALKPLNSAVAGGNLNCVRLLLEAGADANARQAGDISALMGAAAGGNCMMVDLLLEHGAAKQDRCSQGYSAADYARKRGHEDVIMLLEQQ